MAAYLAPALCVIGVHCKCHCVVFQTMLLCSTIYVSVVAWCCLLILKLR